MIQFCTRRISSIATLWVVVLLALSHSQAVTIIMDDFSENQVGETTSGGAIKPFYAATGTSWVVDSGKVATNGSAIENYLPVDSALNFSPDTQGTQVSLSLGDVKAGPFSATFKLRQTNRSDGPAATFELVLIDTDSNRYVIRMSPSSERFGKSGFALAQSDVEGLAGASLTQTHQAFAMTFDPDKGFALQSSAYADPVIQFDNRHHATAIQSIALRSGGLISWYVDDVVIKASMQTAPEPSVTHAMIRQFHRVRSPHPGWRNSLKPTDHGSESSQRTLSEKYQPNYAIVLSDEPTLDDKQAADELARWLNVISGADFQIYPEVNRPSGMHVISIGQTRLYQDHNFPSVDLKQDGYRLAWRDDNLFIAGGSRQGVVNGVMAFLEEDLGCRWYQPDASATVIPMAQTLRVDAASRDYVSPYDKLRRVDYSDVQDGPWQRRNRVRQGIWNGMICHTYNALLDPRENFEAYPEYYSLINGQRTQSQLCPTHPDVQRLVLAKIKDNLQKNPDVEYVDVSPNDGRGYCRCPRCEALSESEGTMMGPLLELVNHVADGIADQYPNVLVTTLSYLDTVVPTQTFGPSPNVMIWMANDRHAWGFQDMFIWETDQSARAMKAWEDRWQAPKIIWDYPSEYHGAINNFSLPVVAGNLQWYADHGAEGIYFQTLHNPNYAFPQAYQRSWIFAKLAWNPQLDTQELVRDFNFGFYGPAAPHMQAWHELLWQTWIDWHRDIVESTDTPWDVIEARKQKRLGRVKVDDDSPFWLTATSILRKAEQVVARQPIYLKRVQVAHIPLIYRQLEKGPGQLGNDAYLELVEKFENIARQSRLLIVERNVGPPMNEDLSDKLAYWRKLTQPLPDIPYIELSNRWKFEPDPSDVGLKEQWYDSGYSDLAWTSIETGSWIKQGYNKLGLAWYRQSFNVTETMLDKPALWMLFGGVDETAEVYINGKLAYEQTEESTGLPRSVLWNRAFVFDASPFLHSGKNVLAVRVTRHAGQAGIWIPVRIIMQATKPDAQKLTDEIQEMLTIKRVKEKMASSNTQRAPQ